MKHLVLFDGPCPLCHKAVHAIAKRDKKKQFAFASLQGETAKKFDLPPIDSVILVENFQTNPQIYVEGKAVARIAKHLGRFLYLPNWLYRFIAKHRFKVCKRGADLSNIEILP